MKSEQTHEEKPELKVCVIAACPFPANHGTPGSIRELSEGTAAQGHEVHVVTYHFGDEEIETRGIHVHRIKSWFREDAIAVGPTNRKPIYDLQLIFKAISVVRKYDCDVIHAHGYEAALAAFWVRLFTWRPFVYSAHNSMSDELASYNFFKFRWIANSLAWVLDTVVPRMGNACIPHSDNMQEFLAERRLQKKMTPVINFGIDLTTPPESEGEAVRRQYFQDDSPTICYAGVMNEFQRLDLLLEAMVDVLDAVPNARLLMIVTIDQPEHQTWVREKADSLKLGEHVVLTEPQALEGVQHLVRASDVTVVPRPNAPGFPIKLLNYMAAKRPCVMFASSCSGLTHGESVYLANEDTSGSLANALIELLKDEPLQAAIAGAAFEFVTEHHDRKRSAQRVVDAYVKVLQPRSRWKKIVQRPTAIPKNQVGSDTSAANPSQPNSAPEAPTLAETAETPDASTLPSGSANDVGSEGADVRAKTQAESRFLR